MEAQLHYLTSWLFEYLLFWRYETLNSKEKSNVQFPVQDSKMNLFHIIHVILVILGISLFDSITYHFAVLTCICDGVIQML